MKLSAQRAASTNLLKAVALLNKVLAYIEKSCPDVAKKPEKSAKKRKKKP